MVLTTVMETLERIRKHKGVVGVIIAGNDGQIHKSTLSEELTQIYASEVSTLAALAANVVRELDPQDEIEFLRVRSLKHEVMVAPKDEYIMIVIQEATGGC